MAKYSELEAGAPQKFGDNLLLIYGAKEHTSPLRPIVIFVHGLNSTGLKTWRPVLESSWIQSQDEFDVGVVSHISGCKRYGRVATQSPVEVARNLATEIRQFSYRRVILVGHSMGGLIAKETLRQLHLADPEQKYVRRVSGLVTLCSPATGSGAASLLALAQLRKDYVVLRRRGELLKDLDSFLSTNVDFHLEPRGVAPIRSVIFGASARSDIVVSPLGAELGLPADQRGQLGGGHSSTLRLAETHDWIEDAIRRILAPPRSKSLQATKGQPMVAQFAGSGAFPGWERLYAEALAAHTDQSPVAAVDVRRVPPGNSRPHLLLRAFASSAAGGLPEAVKADVLVQDSGPTQMALGICPVGEDPEPTVTALVEELDAPSLRWFRGVTTDAELLAALVEFMSLAVGSLGHWPSVAQTRRIVLADEN